MGCKNVHRNAVAPSGIHSQGYDLTRRMFILHFRFTFGVENLKMNDKLTTFSRYIFRFRRGTKNISRHLFYVANLRHSRFQRNVHLSFS